MLGDAALERPPLTEDVLRRALATSSARAILTPDNAPPPFSEKVMRTRGVAFSRDGRLAVTATTKGAEVWDTKTGRRLAQSGSVYGSEFSFTSDGTSVLWGSSDQVSVWDWSKGGHAGRNLEAPDSPVMDIHNSSPPTGGCRPPTASPSAPTDASSPPRTATARLRSGSREPADGSTS